MTGKLEVSSNDQLASLRGVERIVGSLKLSDGVDDLTSLACLQSVSGTLSITQTALANLGGLEQLERVGGTLSLDRNAALASIAALGGLTEIAGELRVADNPALTTLEGLEWLTHAQSGVRIERNAALISLRALSGLTEVDGILSIASNPSLTSLVGLEQLSVVGRGGGPERYLDIDNNPITSLQPLGALSYVYGLRIANSNRLVDLGGLEGLADIESELGILANLKLADISALSHARTVGSIYVRENPELTNLDGLDAITETSALNLFQNPKLVDLSALANLKRVLGSVEILEHVALTHVDALAKLDTIGGNLMIIGNTALASLNGLRSVRSVEWLMIENNASLIDLSGLSSIQKVGAVDTSSFTIKHNPKLTTLRGLDALTSLNARVEIIANDSLLSLDGLGRVTEITATFDVLDNPSLESLRGLERLERIGFVNIGNNGALRSLRALTALRRVDESLFISLNRSLPTCDCEWLLDRIGAANVGGSVSFELNDDTATCL